MIDAVIFDLGHTLVAYFEKAELPALLEQSIGAVRDHLRREGLLHVGPEVIARGVEEENHEAADHRVRPLEGRLARIFQLDAVRAAGVMDTVCRCFLQPILDRAQRYEDAWPVLEALGARGYKTAIISNLPWGSPAGPWHEEVERQGLSERVDLVIFCTEVGWRKPARQIFEYTLDKLQVRPENALFVGDNPRWDLVGPRAVGMEALYIDRRGSQPVAGEIPIRSLHELWQRL